jgi:predicted porin
MNNTIKLAVASALLAAASSASAAGGIVAGDWTLDIGGIVNAYYTSTKFSGTATGGTAPLGIGAGAGASSANITTGLLPNYLTVSGKTRQNDLDVTFLISMNPGSSSTQAGIQDNTQGTPANGAGGRAENRQAFLTFGDAAWGSIKLGKDLGIYASDAILNDMTLLGVGAGAGSLAGNTTTLGRIGTGFMYADWKAQVAYSSPNFNGLQFTAGVTQAWNATAGGFGGVGSGATGARGGNEPGFEGKVSYDFAADAVKAKVWASALSQKLDGLGSIAAVNGVTATAATGDVDDGDYVAATNGVSDVAGVAGVSRTATAWDIGTTVSAGGFGLTGYYGEGKGIGQTFQFNGGFDAAGNKRKSEQYYVQGTYALPGVGTKLGVSYGESELKGRGADAFRNVNDSMWVAGVYHPITKHLNLVAEYSESERDVNDAAGGANVDATAKAKTVSLGAILFF